MNLIINKTLILMSRLLTEKELAILRRFFDYDLSEDELVVFQKKLDADKAFAVEVENYKKANDAIDQLIALNSVKDNKMLDLSQKQKSNTIFHLVKQYLVPIAAVIALCVGLSFFFFNKTPLDQIALECNAYTQSMTNDILRGEASDIELAKAEEVVLRNNIASYNGGDLSAKTDIKQLAASSNSINVKELASWWMVNIYLEEADTKSAKLMLNKIINNPDFNSGNKAIYFLKQLK